MAYEGPLRTATGDARGAGWRRVAKEGRRTRFERPGVRGGARLLWVFPLAILTSVVAALFGVRPVALSSWVLLFLVMGAWPRRRERLDIDPRRVVWRDRMIGARVRCRPEQIGFSLRSIQDEAALVVVARQSEHLLASGTTEDVQALLEELHEAIERARQPD